MGQKQRGKLGASGSISDGSYLHCELSYIHMYLVIPGGMRHPYAKKPQQTQQTQQITQTVFKISSADKEKKFFVHHLLIMKGMFHFNPRHI